jgi:hypothetical protein
VAFAAGLAGTAVFREVMFAFEDGRAAAQRLAGFGGEVEVLSPPAVRDRPVSAATQLLARYASQALTGSSNDAEASLLTCGERGPTEA